MAYHNQQGVDTAIVRIFNTYGPRMRPHDGRAIPNFVRQALANEPLTVYGDGSQTRSFCYVDDLVRGIVLLAESDEHFPVNIGNPGEFTILELAQAVLKVTGSASEIVYEALPVDDPQIRQPDITRARQLLGWEPEIQLEDGLRRMLGKGAGRCLDGGGSRRRPWRPPPGSACSFPAWACPRPAPLRTCRSASTTRARPSSATSTRSSPQYQALHVGVLRVNLYWGGTLGVAKHRPFSASRPARRRLRLDDLRPHRAVRGRPRDQAALLDHRHATLGERRREPEPSPDELRAPARLRLRGGRALQRHLRRRRRPCPAGRSALGGMERAEQPRLPPAAVRPLEGERWVIASAPGVRQDLQRDLHRRARDDVRGRAGRLRCHRARAATTTPRAPGRRFRRSRSSSRRSVPG